MSGYSIAFEAGTNHGGEAYIDMRISFYDGDRLQNVHALAIPLRSRHTVENIAMCVARLMDALIGNICTDKLVRLSSDGAASIGRISGAVTRLEKWSLTLCTESDAVLTNYTWLYKIHLSAS